MINSKKLFELKEEGFINLNSPSVSVDKESDFLWFKTFYTFKTSDGKKFYFKKERADTNQHFAEVIACGIAKELNINCVNYQLAKYDGEVGIISESFLKEDEIFITGEELLSKYLAIEGIDIIQVKKYNEINIIELMLEKHYPKQQVQEVIKHLLKTLILDTIILGVDRNAYNWGVIANGKSIVPAPVFDNELSFNLWIEKDSYTLELEKNASVKKIRDALKEKDCNISNALNIYNKESNKTFLTKYLHQLEAFEQKDPELFNEMLEKVKNLNITKTLKRVEKNIGVELPKEVKHLVKLTVKTRKLQIKKYFYENKIQKNSLNNIKTIKETVKEDEIIY